MKLPQHLSESLLFAVSSADELIEALAAACTAEEAAEIKRLVGLGLPPVTSAGALSVMMGYNPGFVWSLLHRTGRYYRRFEIPKGRGTRVINAPKVALKIIQKWLSIHFQKVWQPTEHVHGFVPGRSHLSAASRHLEANWVFSVDIENFFPSVERLQVSAAFASLGYQTPESIECLTQLCCLGLGLVQGAPTSPVISNIALHNIDNQLAFVALSTDTIYTRYADDIVFSGRGECPEMIRTAIEAIFVDSGWKLAAHKSGLASLPSRLKVHGLLVHGDRIRLTKGYRNRIRAYRHLAKTGVINTTEQRQVSGHLNYATQVEGHGPQSVPPEIGAT